jgi:DNA-binding transcriptional ArsR family regulator
VVRATADSDVFRAIADSSRRTLLDALTTGPKSFGELHSLLPITKGAVSQHLSILAAVGLITVNEVDRSQRYALAPAPLEEVDQWLSEYRVFWNERLDRLEHELVRRRREAP